MRHMRKLAITMGDPGGVGPEVIVRALSAEEVRECCTPIVIGDPEVMREALQLVKLPVRLRSIQSPEESDPEAGVIEMISPEETGAFEKGRPTAAGGRASVRCIRKAVELSLQRQVGGIVTAPISKEALKMAGSKWHGHTEMIAELTGTGAFMHISA